MGFTRTLIIKIPGKFYLSHVLELLETHMLSNNFHLFRTRKDALYIQMQKLTFDQVENFNNLS
jgi:hypothetical protein